MREFFDGWKRKIGVVTLILACAFAVVWVRSITVSDIVSRSVNHATDALFSTDGSFGWWHQHHDKIINLAPFWYSDSASMWFVSTVPTFQWHWSGFSIIQSQTERALYIPFWSIVIPLTLISLSLLLTKRRKSIQKKITESMVNELT